MNTALAFMNPVALKGNIGAAVVVGVALFLILHFIGKFLRERTGVRIGFIYELFAVAFAAWVGLGIFGHWSIELKSLSQISGAFVIAALVNRYFWELYFVKSGKPPAPKFFSQVFSMVIVFAAFIIIVTINYHQAGVINTMLTTGGVLALTVGLALQDLLGNLIAGFTIHFGQPFKVGDWLIIDGTHVEVMEINWRSSRCRTNDDTYLDVPNASIIKQTVMNLYYPDNVHAIRVQVGLDYDTPPNLAKDCLKRAALNASGVLANPAPYIFLSQFGDSSVNYEIKAFISDHSRYPKITDEIRTNIWYELKRHHIGIPFPHRVVQLNRTVQKAPEDYSQRVGEALKKQSTFAFLTGPQMRQLTEGCRAALFGKGEKIIRQGDHGESMFVILSGSVVVLVTVEGITTQVAQLQECACFGEMSLLTGENRSATVVAEEDALIVELCKENLSRVLKENAKLVEKLGELLAERKLINEGQIAATMAQTKRMAMARNLKASFLGRLKVFFDL